MVSAMAVYSEMAELTRAYPRDPVLAPFFSTYIFTKLLIILAFADDTVYFIGPSVEIGIQKIEEALGYINIFLCDMSLLIFFIKFCLIIFGELRVAPETVSLRIRDQSLFNVDHFKCLGVELGTHV